MKEVPDYFLSHRHAAAECPVVFAAWQGFVSPLRGHLVLSSCTVGDHQLWWRVTASDADAALAMLPGYVLARTQAVEVGEVAVP